MHRRKFVANMLMGAVALPLACGCAATFAAGDSRAALSLSPLADRLFLIEGAGANVVVLEDEEGLLLVDGGLGAHAPQLLSLLSDRFPGRAVHTLVNTHWHLSHTGANDALGARGARIVSHTNTRLWMGTPFRVEWEDRDYPARAAAALPTQTFYERQTLEVGGRTVHCVHLPRAHTDGDVYVHFPDADVIVAGGLVSVGRYPVLDYSTGGFIRGMRDASRALQDLAGSRTRIVPGIGAVQDRAHLAAQTQMLEVLAERLPELLKQGLSAEEMLAGGATAEFDAVWGDPKRFVHNAYWGMWGHVTSLGVF